MQISQWSENYDGISITRKLKELSGRGWRKTAKRHHDGHDLESGKIAIGGVSEFKPPPKQWPKLKYL